jgi:hypothetical protein
MSIHHSGTFEYEAEFTKDGFGISEIVLAGTDRSGENEDRLVGLNPRIRFWNDRLVIIASGRDKASVRNVSFPIGDAVRLVARPGDQLFLVRTGCGGIGLSLLRDEKLILATGAITSVPLGPDMKVIAGPDDYDPLSPSDTWLEFSVEGERVKLRERDVAEQGSYFTYVERCWKMGIPGTNSCVSVCLRDDLALRVAAIRSAILLANGNLKLVSWDTSERLTHL